MHDEEAAQFVWPLARLGGAVEALVSSSGLRASASAGDTGRARSRAKNESVEHGIESLSRVLEFELQSADVTYEHVQRTLSTAGPALLKVRAPGGEGVLVLGGARGKYAKLLGVDGRTSHLPIATVSAWLTAHLEEPLAADVDELLADSNVPVARRAAGRRALLRTRLGAIAVTRCWMLRPSPAVSLWQHMRHAKLPRRLLVFVLAYGGAAVASVGAWWLIGAAALEGRFDAGTLLAWSFLLLSIVPLTLFAMWSQGVFMIGVSGLMKMRLLAGALKLDPDETRTQGVGQHLARVLDSNALEGLAIAGGFYALTAAFDLSLAMAILMFTSRGALLAVLVAFVAAACGLAGLYFRARERWTGARLQLTHSLVEQMTGHRTRLVQGTADRGHDEEDESLRRYMVVSQRMDRLSIILSMLPRAWLLLGLAMLAPQFAAANSSVGMLAVSLGVTMLALGALVKLTASLTTLIDAAICWRQVAPLLDAVRQPEPLGHVEAAAEPIRRADEPRSGPLFTAQDLAFRFPGRADAILHGCSFRIAPGDRIHLSGPSGAGKSTLVSLLTGMRMPHSGLLLLQGLDKPTLGARAWRRRIAAAPQFHENYLFSDSLAFNLLMSRRWPPTAEDLRWAEIVCRRLDLGDLIDRMPAGLFQQVGEAGWQLSHGERSRVFMARALLQGADLVVLDESFAELDPDSLQRCLPEAAALSRSLLVIAHA